MNIYLRTAFFSDDTTEVSKYYPVQQPNWQVYPRTANVQWSKNPDVPDSFNKWFEELKPLALHLLTQLSEFPFLKKFSKNLWEILNMGQQRLYHFLNNLTTEEATAISNAAIKFISKVLDIPALQKFFR